MNAFAIESPMFHTSHVVDDMLGTSDRYIQLFERAVVYTGTYELARRSASFVLVGDVWIEIVAPGPGQNPARRFAERFGDHLHGVAFHVRGIDTLAATLREHGVRFADTGGVPITGDVPRHGPNPHPRFGPTTPPEGGAEARDDWWSAVIYTHMVDTCGLFEFCEPKQHHNRLDPRRGPGWELRALPDDPLGIVRGSHNTIVVSDLAKATDLWVTRMDFELVAAGRNPIHGTKSAFVRFGDRPGTLVEFAEPDAEGPAARDRERTGSDILHCVAFEVADMARLRAHLAEVGCGLETEDERMVVVDPGWCAGARYAFTASPVGDLVA